MRKKLVGCVCAVAMLAGLTAATASAQPQDKRTYFTFSGPVEMPGVALPAGKYIFHLADPNTSRKTVQVMSADGKRVYGMFFSMPAERRTAATDAEVRFMEAPAGTPPPVKTWWYPGERTGYEFIYSKKQARLIAARTHETVLTTRNDTDTVNEADTSALTRVSAGGEAPLAANNVEPSGVAQKADDAPAPGPVLESTVAEARTELPRTASHVPVTGAIGAWLLLAAAAIHFRQRLRRF